MAAVFALSFIWIQLIAQRHGLVICLLRARTRPGQVAQRRMRVSVIVLVFVVASSPLLAGRLVQWLRFRRSVRSRATDRRRKPRSVPFRHFSPTCTGRVCPSRHAAKTVSTNGWSSNPTRPQIHQFLAWAVRRGYPHNVKAPSPKIAEPAERLQVIISDGGRSNT